MQQTQNYKLNLIETSDAFSPNPLNENTQVAEEQFTALNAAAADLTSRVTALEVHKIAFGTYIGNKQETDYDIGFTPAAVIIQTQKCAGGDYIALTVRDSFSYDTTMDRVEVKIIENGFKIGAVGSAITHFNTLDMVYHYLALA